jgi:hypothetical protein
VCRYHAVCVGCYEWCAATIAPAGVAEARGRALLQQAGPPRKRPEACVATCNVATCTPAALAAHRRMRCNVQRSSHAPAMERAGASCTRSRCGRAPCGVRHAVGLARQAACNMRASCLMRREAHGMHCARNSPCLRACSRHGIAVGECRSIRRTRSRCVAPSQKLRAAVRSRRGVRPQIVPLMVPPVPHRTRVQARRAPGRRTSCSARSP